MPLVIFRFHIYFSYVPLQVLLADSLTLSHELSEEHTEVGNSHGFTINFCIVFCCTMKKFSQLRTTCSVLCFMVIILLVKVYLYSIVLFIDSDCGGIFLYWEILGDWFTKRGDICME